MANIDEFTDSRDGRTYRIVMIGDAVWMAENLDFRCEGSRAYDNLPTNRKQFGLLYTHRAAMAACPNGWRLPRHEDWETLFQNAGGIQSAKTLLCNPGFGFNAQFGGCCDAAGNFQFLNNKACFWSEESFGPFANYTALLQLSDSALELFDAAEGSFSVRCILNE